MGRTPVPGVPRPADPAPGGGPFGSGRGRSRLRLPVAMGLLLAAGAAAPAVLALRGALSEGLGGGDTGPARLTASAGTGAALPATTRPLAVGRSTGTFRGRLVEHEEPAGGSQVVIRGTIRAVRPLPLTVVLNGQALADGGVALTTSRVRLLLPGDGPLTGRVTVLSGDRIVATAGRAHLRLDLSIDVSITGSRVTGPVTVTVAGRAR